MNSTSTNLILKVSCADRPGLTHAISGFLFHHGADIRESQQFEDAETGRFFMRVRFTCPDHTREALIEEFTPIAQEHGMEWGIHDLSTPTRVLVMVSKFGHCLNDLLFRQQVGSLNIEIVAVGSNHLTFQKLVSSREIPFHHIPITADTKPAAEARLLQLVDEYDASLVVLARYMQVLSDDLCRQLAGRAINIHHSFLPSFKGAKPYHQAHRRGVKLVGATAHFVTPDLDEGPIIEQDVARVNHSYSADQMVEAGRDVEALVLSRAVKWHAEHRVFPNGSSTVVLR